MSKTKQFCKTSSVFELNLTTSNRKHFCETSFKNGKLSADPMASYQCVLRFSRKSATKSYDRLQLPPKNHLMLQNATSLRKSAPWPLDSWHVWWRCLLYCACQRHPSLQILFKHPAPAISYKTHTLSSLLTMYRIPGTRKNGLKVQQCSERGALNITCSLRNVLCAAMACTFSTS